ncbi:DUF3291 domain-containing protein [uncultured Pseudoteredinibacter sp.]|uniref:DUF3291 domain-containing protein n=1 Tax=uncultured Pseudoteredinibacter sp. TaxID=1641701 RepID=UPI00260ACE77|nr:DUF3291 domain-containing protein [uncultured Pseudoteredinibacter sp.]MCV6623416.1 DUF3291 domain-containing protein [Cellvibrionaceae bacterium]
MKYLLAQANIAKFRLPQEHPVNADFVNNLDRVNAIAEEQQGFVWRFTGDGNDAMDVQAFDDPNIALNMSVWTDVKSLVNFVYRNQDHRDIMRRRKEWFDKIDFHMVLWWIEEGRMPTPEEAKIRLELLKCNGPSYAAFTFKQPFAPPTGELVEAFQDRCA